ncbi:aminoglycoside phosphotransferase (APT) family kinase protein [Hephaestia caeni]|uniref:Aminoglycoside phosphotransferase (APT) family kinase protein n=1 Tax=Hephaestia caeni TaxID=645617 RepID=A0A397NW42_9SPHN|nr:phosphotransferase family protein [Hephaestia caeni]RIA37964.1 aminoglycoside phosphotransferase (APT) family kinase protein [Hephaestia caeni]
MHPPVPSSGADLGVTLGALLGGDITDLRRLTGGASLQTWAFDLRRDDDVAPLVLRRRPPDQPPLMNSVPLAVEAAAITEAAASGVPVAPVRLVLKPEDGLGEGFVSDRIAGLTLPSKILRDEGYVAVRERLAFRFGEVLARIHAIPPTAIDGLATLTAAEQIESIERSYRARTLRSPVFELALRWLRRRQADFPAVTPTVVHGDFRMGNVMVAPHDVAAVLDWELVHLGDPAEDLGWVTVNSWRFGKIDKVVGGVGSLAALMEGYRAQGGAAIEAERIAFWRALGSLRWGVACGEMSHEFEQGRDPNVERGIIGRRVSETELDLLDILAPGHGR